MIIQNGGNCTVSLQNGESGVYSRSVMLKQQVCFFRFDYSIQFRRVRGVVPLIRTDSVNNVIAIGIPDLSGRIAVFKLQRVLRRRINIQYLIFLYVFLNIKN